MAPPVPSHLERLLAGIDQGIQAHLAWNQRLMRCSLLHESPGDDMLQPDAHRRCTFGQWFQTEREALATLDAAATAAVERFHEAMHDAVRFLCAAAAQGQAVTLQEFQAYEAGQTGMVEQLNRLRQKAADAVLQHDALTGLPLRHGLHYAFDLRLRDAVRNGVPLYLAMVDADHFKGVNDRWGHAVGDLALQQLARLMGDSLRGNDILVRYGGEEFLLLLLGSSAPAVMERLLQEVRTHPLPLPDGTPLRMTVTAGLTQVQEQDTLSSAVDRADFAMLRGKQAGRDRCVLA